MQVFLSYPSEERDVAERINLAIRAYGHEVFFDREDLAPGLEYDQAIALAIAASDLFVFLITPAAVQSGRYTLTELRLAEEKWRHPSGRVLPVMLRETLVAAVPPYLRAVNFLVAQGDVVAETAHEVGRLADALSLTRRVRRRLRTPVGMTALGAIALLGAAAWVMSPFGSVGRASTATADSTGAAERVVAVPLPEEIRHRARAVAPMTDGGFVVAMSAPSEVVRFSPNGDRVGQPIPLTGEPVSASRTPTQIMVVTRAPDGVTVLHANDLTPGDKLTLDPARVKPPQGMRNPTSTSGDIESIAVDRRGALWAVTGERDGDPTVLRFRQENRQWEVASWTAQPDGFGLDARGLVLRLIKGELWGITARTTPSSLFRFENSIRVDEFSGNRIQMIGCAHDLAESADGHLLLLSCDNELQEVTLDDGQLKLLGARATLPAESAPGNWTDELLVPSDSSVIVALNTEATQANDRPVHARIAELTGTALAKTLLDMRDAVVTSMAVTPRSVIAVLRRADGSADAITVRR